MTGHDVGEAIKREKQSGQKFNWVSLPYLAESSRLAVTKLLNCLGEGECFLIRCWHYLPLIAFSFPLVIIPLNVCGEKLKMKQITEKELIVNE